MLKSWTLAIEEDATTGNSIVTFPQDLLDEAGWKEGDSLIWIDNKDGSFALIKEDLINFISNGIKVDKQI